jgi:hypothetical protein
VTPFFPDTSALRRRLRALGEPLRHAILLVALTVATITAIGLARYYWPRSFLSGMPEAGDREGMATLCAHPEAPARSWQHIVVHHSATTGGSAAAFERYHVHTRHWDSLGYHFVIGNGTQTGDGEIEVGGRWRQQQVGSHALGYNAGGIGICLVGDFSTQQPSRQQMQSLRALVRYLSDTYDIAPENVLGHRECEGAQTACPGKHLDVPGLREWLRAQ